MTEATNLTKADLRKLAEAARPLLVVPHWHTRTSIPERVGQEDHAPITKMDSVFIHMRAVKRTDASPMGGQDADAISNIRIGLYFSSLRDFSVEIRAHDVFHADVPLIENMLKRMKALNMKRPEQLRWGTDLNERETLTQYIPRLLEAYGITQAVQYGPGHADRLVPTAAFVEDLMRDINRRITRFSRM